MKVNISLLLLISVFTVEAQHHKEQWEFYFCTVDDHPASIYLDLGLNEIAPVKGKGNIFWVSIKMNHPREDGLSSKEESEKLWGIEDLITAAIRAKHNVIYVGRLTNNGHRDLYFYTGKDQLIEKTLSENMVRFPDYKYDFGVKENDNWDSYFNFLYPSPKVFQSIENRWVLDHMEERGDALTKEREVGHWIYFPTENGRNQFESEIISRNFKVRSKDFNEEFGENKFRLVITRVDKVGRNDIDEYTIKLWELAKELGGEYDGWEAPLLVEKKKEE